MIKELSYLGEQVTGSFELSPGVKVFDSELKVVESPSHTEPKIWGKLLFVTRSHQSYAIMT